MELLDILDSTFNKMIKVLEQAEDIVRRNWPKGKGWKIFLGIFLIVVLFIGLVLFIVWAIVKLLSSITAGGFRNKDLYIPRPGSKRRL